MRKIKIVLLVLLVSTIALLTACAANKETNTPQNNQLNEDNIKLFEQGTVIKKEENSWLITAYNTNNGQPYIDAVSFIVNDTTVIENKEQQILTLDDIAVGSEVEVWQTGIIEESYPRRTAAAKILLLNEDQEESISKAQAVQTAIQTLTKPALAIAVKKAKLDDTGSYWLVELVNHEHIEDSIQVRIDAKTGEIVQELVAENEAFRIFAPLAGTEVRPGFTVKGEARVFEAAFSWQLEDGHNILAEGNETAETAGPDWGSFEFEVSYEKASQPNLTLILFVYSAKDGSIQNQLTIPFKAPEELINYNLE